ncbi:unnamed protein product [Rotaria sordida]|uniref:Uncharacterized protein n=1 Tax=Rotaria sordida TaxID=392033 RepID=A0A814GP13_9BILA|nr:unnamed protein product [Rotaria sordida]CAF1483370.1 unnamed protein product [Rotaria sordida]
MDLLYAKIVQEIEAYITDDNLNNDYIIANCICENDGWIRLELLSRCNRLSSYNYDTILQALHSKYSNIIELSSFTPRCIRRRCQPLTGDSIQDNRTVVVTGLPYDVRHEELIEFFNHFYPVKEIKMFSLSNRFNGTIHIIFKESQDALKFVQQSKLMPILYVNNNLSQLSKGYTIVCKMLIDDDINNNFIKQNHQQNFLKGKSFSTRLANLPSRISFNTNISSANDNTAHHKSRTVPTQTKTCLKSNTCATEQILFCQNIAKKKPIRDVEYERQKIVYNKFSYEFYIPDHLLKHTLECVIISVLNPHCFTIQLKEDAIEFDKFQKEINDFYNTIHDKQYHIKPEQILLNSCVICSDPKSSDNDKIWFRSQILDFDSSDNTVNLFYVDFGTWEEYVPINRLRHITDGFHRHQVFSITCRLAHILPLNHNNDQLTWTENATNQFLAVIDQVIPEIELLSFTSNGCFQTKLFVMNSGQHVCVNDYMIHIKQAKPILNTTNIHDDRYNCIQLDEHDINDNGSPIHPVVALYNRLGENFQQSLVESRTTSISSSAMSSPSSSPRLYVKLIHVNIETNTINREKYNNSQQLIPIVFVHYQKTILIPDFNIYTLLNMIDSTIDIHTIERFALSIRYTCVHITQEFHFDIFTQLSSLFDIRYLNNIGLYTIDFVGYILEQYNFPIINVFRALENAKQAQLHASDLALWFTMNNELNTSFTLVSNDTTKMDQFNGHRSPIRSMYQQSSISIRLPFSNRLINPM